MSQKPLPQDWATKLIKDICFLGRGRVISQKELEANPGSYPVYSSQTKDKGVFGYIGSYDFEGEYVTWTTDGANAGTVFYRYGKFNCTNVCGTLKSSNNDMDMRYLALALSTQTKKYVSYVGNPKLMNNVVAEIPVLIPPKQEQSGIADIIFSVDQAIDITRQEIHQTRLVKRALVQELLTRGLPGQHTRFKQTPLGEIPENWEVVKLEQVAEVQTGIAKNKKISPESAISVPYLRVANVQDGYVDLTDMKEITIDERNFDRYRVRKGDVLFNEGGDNDKLGRGCVWEGQINPCVHQNHVFVVRCSNRINPFFLSAFAGSAKGKKYFLKSSKQTTNLASINSSQLKAFSLPLPPIEEQDAIIKVLQTVAQHEEQVVAQLQQYDSLKAGLMQMLLTGEKRVVFAAQQDELLEVAV